MKNCQLEINTKHLDEGETPSVFFFVATPPFVVLSAAAPKLRAKGTAGRGQHRCHSMDCFVLKRRLSLLRIGF
jgi:hypothetical protein